MLLPLQFIALQFVCQKRRIIQLPGENFKNFQQKACQIKANARVCDMDNTYISYCTQIYLNRIFIDRVLFLLFHSTSTAQTGDQYLGHFCIFIFFTFLQHQSVFMVHSVRMCKVLFFVIHLILCIPTDKQPSPPPTFVVKYSKYLGTVIDNNLLFEANIEQCMQEATGVYSSIVNSKEVGLYRKTVW